MKKTTEPSLEELKKEIEKLKVQKAKKLQNCYFYDRKK